MDVSKVIVFTSPHDIYAEKLLRTGFSERQLHD
jgi:hypothetical protein